MLFVALQLKMLSLNYASKCANFANALAKLSAFDATTIKMNALNLNAFVQGKSKNVIFMGSNVSQSNALPGYGYFLLGRSENLGHLPTGEIDKVGPEFPGSIMDWRQFGR